MPSDDELADELAIFGGHTRVLALKSASYRKSRRKSTPEGSSQSGVDNCSTGAGVGTGTGSDLDLDGGMGFEAIPDAAGIPPQSEVTPPSPGGVVGQQEWQLNDNAFPWIPFGTPGVAGMVNIDNTNHMSSGLDFMTLDDASLLLPSRVEFHSLLVVLPFL